MTSRELTAKKIVRQELCVSEKKLREQYETEIKSMYWGDIIAEAKDNVRLNNFSDELEGWAFLGTVFNTMPSGKYYTPFANSNVAACDICGGAGTVANGEECPACGRLGSAEAFQDEIYMEILEKAADECGGTIQSGEGDPCDLFFVLPIEKEEEESE